MNKELSQAYIRAQDHDDFEDEEALMDLENQLEKLLSENSQKEPDAG